MGRAAYPRDLTQRFARSARLRDGAGPAVADGPAAARGQRTAFGNLWAGCASTGPADFRKRSEEHTSELQSRSDLVCRLLLEKKKRRNSFVPPNEGTRGVGSVGNASLT